eukprot:Gb_27946 [translate_table: standard]
MQTLRLQHHEQNYEPEAQEDAHFSFLTQALTVPVHILVSRFRNRREVELVMDVSDSASRFDCLLENYETVSVRAQHVFQMQALQESWDNLWTSQEPLLVPAIPLIGEQMSAMNRIRANLLKKMDSILESLQVLAKALLQYAEINSSIAEELKMEGIERLAMDKLFLAGLEEELVKRINIVSTKGSIHMLCPISVCIESLIRRSELVEPSSCEATTQNTSCNSLKESAQPPDIDNVKNSPIQSHNQIIEKVSGSSSDSHLQAVYSGALLQQNTPENDAGQSNKTLGFPLVLQTSPMVASFTSEASAHNSMKLMVLKNSSSASEEHLPQLALEKELPNSQNILPNKGTQVDKHMHYSSQSVIGACNDTSNSPFEASEKNKASATTKKMEECRDSVNVSEGQSFANLKSHAYGKIGYSPSPTTRSSGGRRAHSVYDSSPVVKQYPSDPILMTQVQPVSTVQNNARVSELPCRSSLVSCTKEDSSRHTPVLVTRPNESGNDIGESSESLVRSGTKLKIIDSQFHGDAKDSKNSDIRSTHNFQDKLSSQWRETKRSGLGWPSRAYPVDDIPKINN